MLLLAPKFSLCNARDCSIGTHCPTVKAANALVHDSRHEPTNSSLIDFVGGAGLHVTTWQLFSNGRLHFLKAKSVHQNSERLFCSLRLFVAWRTFRCRGNRPGQAKLHILRVQVQGLFAVALICLSGLCALLCSVNELGFCLTQKEEIACCCLLLASSVERILSLLWLYFIIYYQGETFLLLVECSDYRRRICIIYVLLLGQMKFKKNVSATGI